VLAADRPVRQGALFGQFGGAVNLADGRFVYMRYPEGEGWATQLHHYTLMPVHMRSFFEASELAGAQLAGGWLGAHLTVRGGQPLVRKVVLAVVLALIVKLGRDLIAG
ncbi:MAG: hypothetical protein ACK4N5_02060, partial [Myxococcales bacterium]